MTIQSTYPVAFSVLAVAIAGAQPARAQDAGAGVSVASTTPAAEDNSGLQDIIVTARKTRENLQSVPIAVTAFSGDQLRAQNAAQLQDVARLTPGLIIRPAAAGSAQAVFQIRGQFQNDTVATLDPSVGVYVDGYYIARAYGINADLLDVENVQTLKGPQGTVFGRNTTGGAILIQTNDPVLDKFSGSVSGTYGRFNERSGTAIINIPIVTDRIALRAAYQIKKRDGYILNNVANQKVANQDSWTGRAKLLVKATDNLSVVLSAEVFRTDFLFNPYRLAYVNSANVNLAAGTTLSPTSSIPTRIALGAAALQNDIAAYRNADTVGNSTLERNIAKTETYMGTVTLDTFFGAIKFIGGYRHTRARADDDIDGSRFVLIDSVIAANLKQYSGEVQVTGKALNDAVDFVGGAFYFHESGTDGSTTNALLAINPNNPNITFGDVGTRSQGVYGQASWHATDALTLTGGIRYSVEDKDITLFNRSFSAASNTFVCSLPTTRTDCGTYRSDAFSGVSYTAGLDYKITQDILTYAKVSKGFRSGGQNLRSAGSLSSFVPFKPETVISYEGGLKSEVLDRHLRINLAGYWSTITDLQRSTIVTAPSGQTATIVGNAGKARVWGAEGELTYVPVQALELGGTVAYTNPKYVSYIDPNTGLDRSSEPFDNIAKWTFTTSATFTHDFDFGRFSLRGDFIYQGRTPLQAYGGTDAGIIEATTMKPVGILNARAGITFADGMIDLAVFGRNITNNRTPNVALYLPAPINVVATQRRDPATYGLTATFRFGDR